MNALQIIEPEKLHGDVFTMIGKEWMLVTAEKDGRVNTMTASWGGMGILWNKKVAYIFIRPQRYTKEFIDGSERLTLSFYDEEYTDDELYELGDQARLLMDDELLENNSRDDYFKSLKADIEDYHDKSKKIESSSVCSSDEVKYQKIDGDDCAYVTASYFVNENKSYTRTNQTYVLRKDKDGKWKILVFYQTEGDTEDE